MGSNRVEAKPTQCKVCQGPVDQPKVGRTRETCSAACRQRAYAQRKGQAKRASRQAEKEQKRLEALPIYERNRNPAQHKPLYELVDGTKGFRCMACGKVYTRKRNSKNKHLQCCSAACSERLLRTEQRVYDALEVLSQQNSRASWPIKRRLDEGKLSPLCQHCGLPYEPNFGKPGRPRQYCSKRCGKAAYEARWKRDHHRPRVHRYRTCAECGEKFDRTDSRGRRVKRFCSKECKRRQIGRRYYWRKNDKKLAAGMRNKPQVGDRRRRLMKNFKLLENGWKRVGEHGEFIIYVGDEKIRAAEKGTATNG